MRNLSIASSSTQKLPLTAASASSVIAVDAENDACYIISYESVEDENSEVQASILKVTEQVGAEISQLGFVDLRGVPVCLNYGGEAQALVICTKGGDIGHLPMDVDTLGQFEVIGSIDSGIRTAAWSPDETLLALITGDGQLLLMSNTYDVLTERSLTTKEAGEAEQVNVGWGSKQTQFHGSLGKEAAKANPTLLDSVGSSPDDDGRPRISWRGDGTFFSVSTLQKGVDAATKDRRIIRVYDRQGVLQNTSEPVAGLEHPLCWRPSGNLVASTQRFGFEGGGAGRPDRHDVVFFERNGLRHGEFQLRELGQYKVRELLWNADSEILAVWVEREAQDCVQLWATSNYHWYLKQELRFIAGNRLAHLKWHPEKAMHIFLATSQSIDTYTFAWETYASTSDVPVDTGIVVVVDGGNLLITPFRTQNVPPPMCSHTLDISKYGVPVHASISAQGDVLAVLFDKGLISLWRLQTRLEFGRGQAVNPVEGGSYPGGEKCELESLRQIYVQSKPGAPDTFRILTLASMNSNDVLTVFKFTGDEAEKIGSLELPSSGGRIISSATGIFWQSIRGEIFSISSLDDEPCLFTSLPAFCFLSDARAVHDDNVLFVGRSDAGRLFCVDGNDRKCILSANSSSFLVAAGFVIYTTHTHEVIFASLDEILRIMENKTDELQVNDERWERRRIERGSRIVTAVPSNMSLVLQMPRGNLETIYPRPLVINVVKRDIDFKDYRKAFLACRKHRVDLTVLILHDSQSFLDNLEAFVDQIDEVDYINLLLSNIGQSTMTTDRISLYCDAIRKELERRSIIKYVYSILTAFVVKKPADYEAGLALLLRIRDENSELVEDAVKYIIFLVDADKLFDTALGMYDFSLVLLIAQHSQKDPREYLPFLRELRALPTYYQRHRIDDHLKRLPMALANLHLAGPGYFDDAIGYIEKHRLFTDALKIWKDEITPYMKILSIYGDYLFERREFGKASWIYLEAQKDEKAMVSFERALMWREAFELSGRLSLERDSVIEMAHRIADDLISKKRFNEAAITLLDYAENQRLAVGALVQGNLFAEARRVLKGENDLLVEIVYPALLDSRTQFIEDINEMRAQLEKQVGRLRELRVKKIEQPDAFYGIEDDPMLHDVDVMTDVSMAPTTFTRYTIAPSTTSKASKRTSRSKRKMERKIGSGRKGTIDEEEYLLNSIGKLSVRLNIMESEASIIIPQLLQCTEEHRTESKGLREEITTFRDELAKALDEIWPPKPGAEDENGQTSSSTWAERMEDKKRERRKAVESIVKPSLTKETDEIDLAILRI